MSTLQTDGPNVSDTFSGSETVVDLAVPSKSGNKLLKAEEAVAAPVADAEAQREGPKGAEIKLSQRRKWFLLLVFSVAQVLCAYT